MYIGLHVKHPLFLELFHQPTLIHNFLYSFTICLLHYYPRHVSSINMPIFRRKNYIHTASGIFALSFRSQPVYCADVYRGKAINNAYCIFCSLKYKIDILILFSVNFKFYIDFDILKFIKIRHRK